MTDSNRTRALRLLGSGALGGTVVGGAGVVVLAAALPPDGLVGAGLGVGAVLVFFALGQGLQVLFAEAQPIVVMMMTMVSYLVRVSGLVALAGGLAIWAPQLSTVATGLAMIVTVAGWLGAEIWTFTRLRIPAFDSPQAKTD